MNLTERCDFKKDGDVSDGYHTFNELYHHRAILFSMICNQNGSIAWKSKLHHDGTMFGGMFIVGINTPGGQATYHYDIEPYWELFKVNELECAPEWDGHTSAQAIERIKDMAITAKDLHEQLADANSRADAAVADLKQSEHDNGKCDYCKHRTDNGGCGNVTIPWVSCSVVNRWEWRGVREDV